MHNINNTYVNTFIIIMCRYPIQSKVQPVVQVYFSHRTSTSIPNAAPLEYLAFLKLTRRRGGFLKSEAGAKLTSYMRPSTTTALGNGVGEKPKFTVAKLVVAVLPTGSTCKANKVLTALSLKSFQSFAAIFICHTVISSTARSFKQLLTTSAHLGIETASAVVQIPRTSPAAKSTVHIPLPAHAGMLWVIAWAHKDPGSSIG